jgi:hypothetical protein
VRGWRGIFAGALSLIALQTVVGSDAAASRTGGAFTGIASLARRALSPGVALLPDIRAAATATGAVLGSAGGELLSTKPTTPAAPSHGTTTYV